MEGSTGTFNIYKDGFPYGCTLDSSNMTTWSTSVVRENLYMAKG